MQKLKNNGVSISSMNISFEPLDGNLPEEVERFGSLFFDTVNENSKNLIKQIDVLMDKYPDIPVLVNWKLSALQLSGASKESLYALILESYKNFPNYLFAKTAYAQICILNNEWQKVPDIFNNIFILNGLYPEREVFHVTEVITFYHITGKYHCYTKNVQSAQACIKLLEQLNAMNELFDLSMTLLEHSQESFLSTLIGKTTGKKAHKK